MGEFKTIDGEYIFTTVIEKSKFICRLAPVSDEKTARLFLNGVIKSEVGATHNCYAYVLTGENEFKFSDDGEPHGTAGQPILEAVKSKNLKCVIAVVTRYFGGIKLGTGGLSRAYFQSAINCINSAKTVDRKLCSVYEIKFDYNTYSKVSQQFVKEGVKVLSSDYSDGVKVVFGVVCNTEKSFMDNLSLLLNGKIDYIKLDSKYLSF